MRLEGGEPIGAIGGAPVEPEGRWTLLSDSPETTFRLGERVGREAVGGEVIGLIGPLGAGKSRFVQGLAKGLGITDRYISSPTFILVHSYEGPLPLHHIDLYRLESQSEIASIGLDEYFEGEGIAAVEWADRGATLLPADRLMIEISYRPAPLLQGVEESKRKVILSGEGPKSLAWLKKIRGSWEVNR